MEFEINNQKWQIEEVEDKQLFDYLQSLEPEPIKAVYGCCNQQTHTIWINKILCEDQKEMTLAHELTHCYLWSLGVSFAEYDEEVLCNMIYGLNTFINSVMEKWKSEVKE